MTTTITTVILMMTITTTLMQEHPVEILISPTIITETTAVQGTGDITPDLAVLIMVIQDLTAV
jgi:hypothetical protein